MSFFNEKNFGILATRGYDVAIGQEQKRNLGRCYLVGGFLVKQINQAAGGIHLPGRGWRVR